MIGWMMLNEQRALPLRHPAKHRDQARAAAGEGHGPAAQRAGRPREPRPRRSCPAEAARSSPWPRSAKPKGCPSRSRFRRASGGRWPRPAAQTFVARRSPRRRWCRGLRVPLLCCGGIAMAGIDFRVLRCEVGMDAVLTLLGLCSGSGVAARSGGLARSTGRARRGAGRSLRTWPRTRTAASTAACRETNSTSGQQPPGSRSIKRRSNYVQAVPPHPPTGPSGGQPKKIDGPQLTRTEVRVLDFAWSSRPHWP